MTPKEFKLKCEEIYIRWMQERVDIDAYRSETNKLMAETLIQLGYEDGVKDIRNTRRW